MPAGDEVSEQSLGELLAMMPFAVTLGIELDRATPGEVAGRLRWREELCTAGGVLHGGAMMSFADSLGAVCAYLNLPRGATTSTISSSTNLLAAVREGHIAGTARPLRVGRSVIVVQTDVRDAAGQGVAQITQAQAVLRP